MIPLKRTGIRSSQGQVTVPLYCRRCGRLVKETKVAKYGTALNICSSCMRK